MNNKDHLVGQLTNTELDFHFSFWHMDMDPDAHCTTYYTFYCTYSAVQASGGRLVDGGVIVEVEGAIDMSTNTFNRLECIRRSIETL